MGKNMPDGRKNHVYPNDGGNFAEKFFRKRVAWIASALLLLVAVFIVVFTGSDIHGARTMEVFKVGGIVSMTRGTPDKITARVGARINDGYMVFTGHDSTCHILMDRESLFRMDSESAISVEAVSASLLEVRIESGQVLFDVQERSPGRDVTIRVGNSAIGVRGTLFVAGFGPDGGIYVVMLDGEVVVDGETSVVTGYVASLVDGDFPVLAPMDLLLLDVFVLRAIYDFRDRLLDVGLVTEEDLEWIGFRLHGPDYIEIQGIRISTRLTGLGFYYGPAVGGFVSSSTLLNLENHNVRVTNDDLKMLGYMTGLVLLQIRGMEGADLELISGLSNLRHLRLNNNGIVDISPLSQLVNLERLYLVNNEIVDISALEGMTGLHRLSLGGNRIYDISPLSHLENLEVILMSDNEIGDISALGGLDGLRHIVLSGNRIYDISPLSYLDNLEVLLLSNNEIENISAFAGLTGLRSLSMGGNRIVDIGVLANLYNMQHLRLQNNDIEDIWPIDGLTGLRELELSDNLIVDVSPLSGMPHLTDLRLRNNRIVDISPIAGSNGLRVLDLSDNMIVDISPLLGMLYLTDLHIRHNRIVDISPLAYLRDPVMIVLVSNPVDDFAPVAHISNVVGRP